MERIEAIVKKEFKATGTICESCAKVIENAAKKVEGVSEASFAYATEKGHVVYDDEKADISKIFSKIEDKGYKCSLVEEIMI